MQQININLAEETIGMLDVIAQSVGETREQVIHRLFNCLKQEKVRLSFREYVFSMLNHFEELYYKHAGSDAFKGKVLALQVLTSIWYGDDFSSFDANHQTIKKYQGFYNDIKEQYLRKIFNVERLY